MATWDVTINGINFSTEASRVDKITGLGVVPARTYTNVANGFDGVASTFGPYEPGVFGMRFWIDGVDRATGLVSSPLGSEYYAWENLNYFLKAFSYDDVLPIRIVMPDASVRICSAQLVAMAPPEWITSDSCYVNVSFLNPETYWEDEYGVTTGSYTGLSSVKTLSAQSGNGFINDAVFVLTANVSMVNPQFNCTTANSAVRYQGTLAVGQVWTVDCGAETSKVGTASVLRNTTYQVRNFMRITAPYGVFLTSTSGGNSSTAWSVAYRSKYF